MRSIITVGFMGGKNLTHAYVFLQDLRITISDKYF